MKRNAIFLGLVISMGIISCQSKTTDESSGVVTGTDSSMMSAQDNKTIAAASANTNAENMNSTITDTTVNKVEMVKPDLSKKGKKGKVSISMAPIGTGEMVADKEGFYTNAEVLPGFPGGEKGLEKFFEKNIEYPQDASDNGVEGIVNINFAVDENGKIYAPKMLNEKIGYGVEEEALRVFSKMPKWTPGKIKGKNVKTRFTLPVKFQLI